MRAIGVMAVTFLVVTACAAPEPQVFPSPAPSLAARPSALPDDTAPADTPTASIAPTDPASAEAGSESTTGAASTEASLPTEDVSDGAGGEPSQTPNYATIARIDDPAGDVGLEGPEWADLVGLELEDDGTTLRIVIDFAAALPAALDEDEVVGVGVDLMREDDGESRFQVFVDGGSDGWYAYFQRQDGFIPFPGSFLLGGSRIVLTIPAETIGNPVEGQWRAFLDWSGPGLVLHPAASDRAPDEDWRAFRR